MLRRLWPAGLLILLTLGLLGARAGGLLQFAFPVAAIAVGMWMERVGVGAIASYVLWLWTLTPLVRRLADLQSGWHDPSLILLTPYLVTVWPATRLLAGVTVFPARAHALPRGQAVFVLAALGIATGIPLGFAASIPAAGLETLNYLVPVAFGWYVASTTEDVTDVERVVVKTFLGTALVSAIYGIYQYVSPPAWDVEWMRNSAMTTIGRPEPFGVRVFSTMHSPGVFALFIFIGVAIWLARPRLTGLPTATLASVGLLLSEVRTAWVALAVAAVMILFSSTNWARLRLLTLVSIGALAVAPFIFIPEVAERASSRVATFAEPDSDQSAVSRVEGHLLALEFLASHPLGAGIGASDPDIEQLISMRDSMLVAGLVQFGLIGTLLCGASVFLLFGRLWTYYRTAPTRDGVGLACAGIGLLSVVFFGAVAVGLPGAFLWLIGGLAVAHARRADATVAASVRPPLPDGGNTRPAWLPDGAFRPTQ